MTPFPITVPLTISGRAHVELVLYQHKQRAKRTAAAYRRRHGWGELDAAGRAALTADIRDNARGRRAAGKLLDTQDSLLTEAVRRELARRGIDLDNPPPFERGADLQGRWPGSTDRDASERISGSIPRVYVTAATGIAFQASAPHFRALEEWGLAHPEWNGFRRTVSPEAMAEREAITALVTTPADIYRDALDNIPED